MVAADHNVDAERCGFGRVLDDQPDLLQRLTERTRGAGDHCIRFTDREPKTAWNKAAANEYGFYSNVNPNVDHPRWSQATERRIGDGSSLFAKRNKTLMFNGYEAQVGQLYAGMDLKKNY